jgi:hypothetical protein
MTQIDPEPPATSPKSGHSHWYKLTLAARPETPLRGHPALRQGEQGVDDGAL